MPRRKEKLVSKEIYHIYNKTIDSKNIFADSGNCRLFLELLKYYRSDVSLVSYSKVKDLEGEKLSYILRNIGDRKHFRIIIISYCLMPNHFHLLVQQKMDAGINKVVSNVLNAFTKYYNLRNSRKGPIFVPSFKAVRIITENQFKHVSRYIHLNPFSGGLVKNKRDIPNYEWSSLKEYRQGRRDNMVSSPDILLKMFDGGVGAYMDFVQNNADYQKTLESVKHLKNL